MARFRCVMTGEIICEDDGGEEHCELCGRCAAEKAKEKENG